MELYKMLIELSKSLKLYCIVFNIFASVLDIIINMYKIKNFKS